MGDFKSFGTLSSGFKSLSEGGNLAKNFKSFDFFAGDSANFSSLTGSEHSSLVLSL